MKFLQTLERKYARYVPEEITKYLLIGQVLSYVLVYTSPLYQQYFTLSGSLLLQGEIWRLVTFLFGPVSESLLFVVFAWYFFYMLGTALEQRWGAFYYVLYLLVGYCALLLFAFLFPMISLANTSLYLSLFLAFAHLFPNFQLLLFFILPIKVKWMGYVVWLGIVLTMLTGSVPIKVLTLLSISNFLIFFYDDIRSSIRVISRGFVSPQTKRKSSREAIHICGVCGINEVEDPNMEIRYCSTCMPSTCYCGLHIKNHQHKRMVH